MASKIEEFEEAFRKDPRDPEVFDSLREAYQEQTREQDLAILLERRAVHLDDVSGASDLLWQAAQLYAQWEEPEAEIRVLGKALDLERGNTAVRERLKELLEEQERWAELIHTLEQEAEDLPEGDPSKARLAELQYRVGEIWEKHLCRLDQALQQYQAAFKTDSAHTDAIEAGRRVYETVGHWEGMASLFQVELGFCTQARRKAELLVELGTLQWKKLHNLEAAARFFNEASHLRPGDESIQENMGELHASPDWPNPEGLNKAAATFVKIAQRREGQGDREGAISYLRRALGADPANEAAYIRLERTYQDTGRWEDLEVLYGQRVAVADEREQAALQVQRADLLERRLGNHQKARECFEAAMEYEGAGSEVASRLMEIYRADGDHERLAELLQDALRVPADQPTSVRLMMELAALYDDHLDDDEAAARLHFEVIKLEPQHERALEAYRAYFKRKGDFKNLSELVRFAGQFAMDSGAPPLESCAILEELADISERHLGDLDGAVEAWQQIALLHPDTERSREALGRIGTQMKRWHHMVEALEREVAQAVTPPQRLQALRKAAKGYFEWQVNPDRTMELLNDILRQSPQDDHALRMMVDICERDSNFQGLAHALEGQLEGIMTKAERISVLRRLGDLFAEKLDTPEGALKTYQTLLDLVPNDSRVYQRILEIMEEHEQWEEMVRFLSHRSAISRSLAEKLAALKRLAEVLEQQLEDSERAIAVWEQVRDLEARDEEALEALARLYAEEDRHHDLLACLGQRLELMQDAPVPTRTELLQRMAELAEERLDQPQEAIRAYEKLAELLPGDRAAQEALTRLYNHFGRYSDLVAVLGRQLEQADDAEQRVVMAFKQADVLEEKLADLDAAAQVFEEVIAEYSPTDLDAHHRLKEIHLRRGDYQRAGEVAERVLFFMDADDQERVALALEISRLWHEKAGDDQRALLAYERVLEMDPDNMDALLALRLLYRRTGSHNRLVKMAQSIFAALEDSPERMDLLLEVGEVYEKGLYDPETAFTWYRRAHDLFPAEPTALTQLRRLAAEYNLWEDLILVLLESRKAHADRDPDQFLDLTFQVARICEEDLNDVDTAFEELEQGLAVDPTGEQVLPHLERLASQAGQPQRMLDIYDRVISSSSDQQHRRALLVKRVELAENELGDKALALQDSVRLFRLDPSDEEVVKEIERLAGEADQWDEAISVHETRLDDLEDPDARVEVCWHLAALLEQRAGDARRAFDVLLRAFSYRPHDTTTVDELWRLARLLSARPPDDDPPLPEGGEAPAVDAIWIGDTTEPEREDSTLEIDVDDLVESEDVADTMEGDAEELGTAEDDEPATDLSIDVDLDSEEPTLDLDPDQIVDGEDAVDGGPTEMVSLAGVPIAEAPTDVTDLDGPPTDLVQIPTLTDNQGPAEPPVLDMEPWEELARAYQEIPTPDRETRIQNLMQVAHIWQEGARDLDRALKVLAEASSLDVEHAEVEEKLLDLAVGHGRFDDVMRIYEDAIETSTDAGSLVRLHLKVGGHLLERDRPNDAEPHLKAVMEIQPRDGVASSQLEEIYLQQQRWADLAAIKEVQLEALGMDMSRGAREAELRGLADIYEEKVDEPERAREHLQELVTMTPDDLSLLSRLADLHQRLDAFNDLADVLRCLADLTDDPDERVAHQVRLAGVYDQELELPDRAIELYKKVLSEDPASRVALRALCRLYEDHDQTDELVEILTMRVDLAGDDLPTIRSLLMELSRIHEHRGDLEAAVAYLQRIRELAGGEFDTELSDALADVLIRAGRAGEAADLIQAQVYVALQEPMPPQAVIPQLLRLARIHDQELEDPGAARAALEQALSMDPRHVDVLQALAQHFLRQEAWSSYVDVLERLIEVRPDSPESLPSLMAAGRIMEDREQDLTRAAQIYRRALEMDPEHLPAIDALLTLDLEEPDAREALLRRKDGLVEDPREKAEVLVGLARLMEARGGSTAEVSGLLHQALELCEDMVTALDSLSSLMLRQGNADAAKVLLQDALTRLDRTTETAQLSYRLGRIHEDQGQQQEALAFFLEAHRRDADDLVLRMALGMNQFRAERWRDALSNLEKVLDHPRTPHHHMAAAEALEAAGVCALNLERDDAARYLEAALGLDPERTTSLSELATLALDDGDFLRAAELLQQELPLTEDTRRQTVLLRGLGDLYLEHLEDSVTAAQYYEELYQGLGNDEASRLEALPWLLPVFRDAGRHETAAEVAEDLVRLLEDRRERRDMLLEAARQREAAGNADAAETHRWAALEQDPGCFEATEALCRTLSEEGRHQELVDLTSSVFATLPPPQDAEQRRQWAALHRAQGMGLRAQGDHQGAVESLEHSLSLTEEMAVRETLAELYEGRAEYEHIALANHRRLLVGDVGRVASLAAIARASAEDDPLRAHIMYQALHLLRGPDEESAAFFERYSPPEVDVEETFPGEVTDDERQGLLGLPEAFALQEVFEQVWSQTPKLLARDLDDLGVSAEARLSPLADDPVAKVYSQAVRALGLKNTAVYLRFFEGGGAGLSEETVEHVVSLEIQVAAMAPPAVIVPAALVSRHTIPELRFLVGRALELTHPAYILAAGVDRSDFTKLMSQILRSFHPRHMKGRRDLSAHDREQVSVFRRALPFKVARKLGDLFRAQSDTPFSSAAWRLAVQKSANRAGLLICGDLEVALAQMVTTDPALDATPDQLIRVSPQVRDLFEFALSDGYMQLRAKLLGLS